MIYEQAVKCIFAQKQDVTVANTVTETSVVSSGVGSTSIPAKLLNVGRTIRITSMGYLSVAALTSPNLTLKLKIGGVTVLTALTSVGGSNSIASITALITCRTTGIGGTVKGQGVSLIGTSSVNGLVNTGTSAVNTTVSNTIDMTVQWGTASASNTFTLSNLTIEILN